MSDNPYDELPYFTRPLIDSHPDRLAAVATLFGMTPAPVTKCRVLEIGCGDGSNLIPMAVHLPDSSFVGVDLASVPIAKGRKMAEDLGLTNLSMVAADLRDIGADYGEFDYIVAHGVYSWVPDEVRDGLMAVCGARLTPQGVAYISYNAYPGRHIRQMLDEMMMYHTRHIDDPQQRIRESRALLHKINEEHLAPAAWRTLLNDEMQSVQQKRDSAFWHDDLSPINRPVYFHEFAAHASAHGMDYLGDAEIHVMSDLRPVPGAPETGVLDREQFLDFLLCRRFRETLLCRRGVALNRTPAPASMAKFCFSAPCQVHEGGAIEGLHGMKISPGQPVLERVASALGSSYPLPLPFHELVPYASNAGELARILLALISSGFAMLHVHDFPCQEDVTERPKATRLARYLAAQGYMVCNVSHMAVQLDEAGRRILMLLDGTRDHEALVLALAAGLGSPIDQVRENLPASLSWMARMGLLEG